MDHERDDGEMLALQAELMRWVAMSADAGASMGMRSDGVTRSGFIALAGRPNVGKSTLANAIVGAHVAIVSDKPQTTRRAIRAVATGPDWQLVLVDLPGVQRPRDALTERMQARVEHELADADGCLMLVNAEQGIGPGDRFIASLLASSPVPVVIAVNKVDRADQGADGARRSRRAAELGVSEDVFPISARTGAGVGGSFDHLVSLLPEGPFYFEVGQRSDQTETVVLAELVREQVLARTREEVPARRRGRDRVDRPAARGSRSGSRRSCSSRPSPRRGS